MVLWFGSWMIPPTFSRIGATPIAFVVAAFAFWIATTNLFVNPSYTATGSYYAAFLFGGYLLARRARAIRTSVYSGAVAFGLAISAWALWQQAAHGEARAHGLFITPATLGSTINLILAPGLVLVAFGVRRLDLAAALVALCTALAASESRGAWVALAAAGVVTFVFMLRAQTRLERTALLRVAGILAAGWSIAWLLRLAGDLTGMPQLFIGDEATQSFRSRLELYGLAIASIQRSNWLLGTGYQAFYYFLEAGRGAVPSYSTSTTDFVHNDYLQALLELGVPGLTGLLLLVVMPLTHAWRVARDLPRPEKAVLIAAIAAIASMAVHGLVDFPFYIPLCVLIYGAVLGFADDCDPQARFEHAPRLPTGLRSDVVRRAVIAGAGALSFWILALPVAAEAASLYGQRQLRTADAQSAAFWLEASRRLDPRDWRYHWYAGQFWSAQAATRSDPNAASLADRAFAAGYAANPREVRNLYERIVLHRRLRTLLALPADAETMRAWANHAVELAPTDPVVQAERERVFKQFPPLEISK